MFSHQNPILSILMPSNIRAPALLKLLNSLRKRDKMLGESRILSLFPNSFKIIHENSCKILYDSHAFLVESFSERMVVERQ